MMFQVILGLLSGLVLFLFGINQLSATLVGQLEEKAKSWLSRFTRNTLTAILTGTLITIAMAPWLPLSERLLNRLIPQRS